MNDVVEVMESPPESVLLIGDGDPFSLIWSEDGESVRCNNGEDVLAGEVYGVLLLEVLRGDAVGVDRGGTSC